MTRVLFLEAHPDPGCRAESAGPVHVHAGAQALVQQALRNVLEHRMWISQKGLTATQAEIDAASAALERAHANISDQLTRLENAGARGVVMAENLRRVHAAGGAVATATDAGNPLTLHGPSIFDEMEAMQAAGLTPADVIVMSTRNGARAMRRDGDFGTLEAGKLADLLVLAENPLADVRAFRSRTHVMRGGRLYPQRALAHR